jgi:hypothetical protein
MHLFRKLRIYISIKNDLIFGVVVANVLWSQKWVYFVVFGSERLYIRLHVALALLFLLLPLALNPCY